MRVLTYKRTHVGDPDNRGFFGINDCMGSVRNRSFDAVVGIGSKTPWRGSEHISGKITWVGIGPFRSRMRSYRGDLIGFERFALMDGTGPDFELWAPKLAKRFYKDGVRSISSSYSTSEKAEIQRVIARVLREFDTTRSYPINVRDGLAHRRARCRKLFSACP